MSWANKILPQGFWKSELLWLALKTEAPKLWRLQYHLCYGRSYDVQDNCLREAETVKRQRSRLVEGERKSEEGQQEAEKPWEEAE